MADTSRRFGWGRRLPHPIQYFGGKRLKTFATVALVIGLLGDAALADSTPPPCETDGTLKVCVTSAALNVTTSIQVARVSITLRITNTSSEEIQLAYVSQQGESIFAPTDSTGVSDDVEPIRVSGIGWCRSSGCRDSISYSSISAGHPFHVQLSFVGRITETSIAQFKATNRATFAGTLSIIKNHQQHYSPLPTPEFQFSNSLRQ